MARNTLFGLFVIGCGLMFLFMLGIYGLDSAVPPLFLGAGATAAVIHWLVRPHEGAVLIRPNGGHGGHGHGGHAHGPHRPIVIEPVWETILIGVFIVFPLYYVPWGFGFWNYPSLFGIQNPIKLAMILQVGVFTLFMLKVSRITPPGAWYWGVLTALGGFIIRWSWHWADYGAQQIELVFSGSSDAYSYSMIGYIVFFATSMCLVFGPEIFLIITSVKLAGMNYIFFQVHLPGMMKAIQGGSTVTHFVGDTTGVPFPEEEMPEALAMSGDVDAMWAWMRLNPLKRVNIRHFLSQIFWVGPGFIYPGIPGFTKIAQLLSKLFFGTQHSHVEEDHSSHDHGDHGHGVPSHAIVGHPFKGEYADMRVQANIDAFVGPLSTGPGGPELTLKFGVVLQLGCPPYAWRTPDLDHWLEHATERLGADVTKAIGAMLYAYIGPVEDLAHGMDPRGASTMAPAMTGIPANHDIPHIVEHFIGHLLDVGFVTHEVILKDVNVSGGVDAILSERLRTHIRQTVAIEAADTEKKLIAAKLSAFTEAAGGKDEHGNAVEVDPKVKADLVGMLAKWYFLGGAGSAGQKEGGGGSPMMGAILTVGDDSKTAGGKK